MSLGLAYWIIILVWVIFQGAIHMGYGGAYAGVGLLVELVLFILVGWRVFGAPLRNS
jgi:hypothetical protein